MTRILMSIVLALGVFSEAEEAQQDLGYAFFIKPQSQATLVRRLQACVGRPERKPEDARVTCRQILESLQATDSDARLTSVDQLAEYARGLIQVECPAGRGKLVSVRLPSGRLDFTWERDFHPRKSGWPRKEMCLANSNTGVWVLSLSCGNPIVSPRAYVPEVEVLVEIPPPAPVRPKMITPVKIFGDSASYLLGDKLVLIRNDTTLEQDEHNTISVRFVRPVTQTVLVTKTDTVFVKKTRTDPLLLAGAFLAGGGLRHLLGNGGDGEVTGCPVNPPNHLADFLKTKNFFFRPSRGGVSIGFTQGLSPLRE